MNSLMEELGEESFRWKENKGIILYSLRKESSLNPNYHHETIHLVLFYTYYGANNSRFKLLAESLRISDELVSRFENFIVVVRRKCTRSKQYNIKI